MAAVECEVRAYGSARDAACLPFGMVGELRRKLGPIALAVVLLFMGVGIMNTVFGFRPVIMWDPLARRRGSDGSGKSGARQSSTLRPCRVTAGVSQVA